MTTPELLKSSLFILSFVWIASSQILHGSRNDIQTSSGPIRGTEVKFNTRTVNQYLGIPFAEPPLGDLRFKKPEPVEPWTETLVADKMPPACMQYNDYPYPWHDSEDGKSEDCLYLNIWVPQSTTEIRLLKLPVIFWLHGGGFTVGSNRKPIYEGRALAAEGEVIVVTVNYRLNAFGFFTSGTEGAPGNAGIYDMVEALKWVNKNIAAFGGDPNKVTVAGESAGAIATGLLCVSPLTKGLFKRVIMASGSPAYLVTENNTANLAESQKVAVTVGCADEDTTLYTSPEEVVDCVKNVDSFELAKAVNTVFPKSARSFLPSYGDEVLPTIARIALINGDFHDVDVFIGNTENEGSHQITTSHPEVFGFFGEKDPRVNKSYGESIIRSIFRNFPNPDAVVQYYLGSVEDDEYYEIREQVHTASGDYSLLCPTVYFAESYSKAGNSVYYYYFVHRPSTTPWAKWMGVVHYEEVQFVFGVPLRESSEYTREERSLSREIIQYWSTFAKFGNTGRHDWPLYSKANPLYVELNTDVQSSYGTGPHKSNCDFLREYYGF